MRDIYKGQLFNKAKYKEIGKGITVTYIKGKLLSGEMGRYPAMKTQSSGTLADGQVELREK